MNTDSQKLITKHNPNIIVDSLGTLYYDFTLYRKFMEYYVQPFRSRYGMLHGLMELETYGLFFRRMTEIGDDLEIEEYDTGPLSAQQYEVNGLMHQLARLADPDLDKIIRMIDEVTNDWSKNEWGNPFSKVAERLLTIKAREERLVDFSPSSPSLLSRNRQLLKKTYSLKKRQDEE